MELFSSQLDTVGLRRQVVRNDQNTSVCNWSPWSSRGHLQGLVIHCHPNLWRFRVSDFVGTHPASQNHEETTRWRTSGQLVPVATPVMRAISRRNCAWQRSHGLRVSHKQNFHSKYCTILYHAVLTIDKYIRFEIWT